MIALTIDKAKAKMNRKRLKITSISFFIRKLRSRNRMQVSEFSPEQCVNSVKV